MNRKRILKEAILTLTLALVLVMLLGCTASQLRKASIIIRDYAVILDKVQDGLMATKDDGFLTEAEFREINGYIVEAAKDGKIAVHAIRTLHSKPAALDAINLALEETDKLLNQGLLHIKNPARKASIDALVLSLRGLLVTAKALLS